MVRRQGRPMLAPTTRGGAERPLAAADGIGDALSGVATDLIFSVASVFAADTAADGWEKIS